MKPNVMVSVSTKCSTATRLGKSIFVAQYKVPLHPPVVPPQQFKVWKLEQQQHEITKCRPESGSGCLYVIIYKQKKIIAVGGNPSALGQLVFVTLCDTFV